jgi:hypothetical protein
MSISVITRTLPCLFQWLQEHVHACGSDSKSIVFSSLLLINDLLSGTIVNTSILYVHVVISALTYHDNLLNLLILTAIIK